MEEQLISEELVCKRIPNGDGIDLQYIYNESAIILSYNARIDGEIKHVIKLSIAKLGTCKIILDTGVLSMRQRRLAMKGDIIAHYVVGQDAVNQMQKERAMRMMEREKAEIADKIKERHRRRELEKIVTQELIDNGELFGEQAKRPPIPRDVVDAVYRRDKGRCVYCGATDNLQLDHIIPFSKGGATTIENLQLLCQKCNLEKSNHIG